MAEERRRPADLQAFADAEVDRILADFGGAGDPLRLEQLAQGLEDTLDSYRLGAVVGQQVVEALRRRAAGLRAG